MGWCSATEIMDKALGEAIKAVDSAYRVGVGGGNIPNAVLDSMTTETLRPFARAVAKVLHGQDWDCVEESEFFDRFPQELLDMDDDEYEGWLVEQIDDAETGSEYQIKLTAELVEFRKKPKGMPNDR